MSNTLRQIHGLILPEGFANTDFNQTVYLDFDGADNLSYNGPVSVEGVTVSAARLDAATIATIVAELNELFAFCGVTFTVEASAEGAYSTVYVGETTSFDHLGSFLGLAESIDVGNADKNDNAFVFSDRVTPEALTDVIAHEVGHLLGFSHAQTTGTLLDYAATDTAIIITTHYMGALNSVNDVVIVSKGGIYTDDGSISSTGTATYPYALRLGAPVRVTLGGDVSIEGAGGTTAAKEISAIDFGSNNGTMAFTKATGAAQGHDTPVTITAKNAYRTYLPYMAEQGSPRTPSILNPTTPASKSPDTPTYTSAPPTECSAMGISSSKTIFVDGALSATFDIQAGYAQGGYRTAGKPLDNASSNTVKAYAISAGALSVSDLFRGTMNVSATLRARGYVEAKAASNTVDAAGIRVGGALSIGGKFEGNIIVNNTGNEIIGHTYQLYDDGKDFMRSKKKDVDVSGNTFTAAGIYAASFHAGNNITGNIAVNVAGTISAVSNTIVKDSAKIDASGNTFAATGINMSGDLVIANGYAGKTEVTTSGVIIASAVLDRLSDEDHSKGSAGVGSVDLTKNTFTSVGFKGNTITLGGAFSGSIYTSTTATTHAEIAGYNHTGDIKNNKEGLISYGENAVSSIGISGEKVEFTGVFSGRIEANVTISNTQWGYLGDPDPIGYDNDGNPIYTGTGGTLKYTVSPPDIEAYGIRGTTYVSVSSSGSVQAELGGFISASITDSVIFGSTDPDKKIKTAWSVGLRTASLMAEKITGVIAGRVSNFMTDTEYFVPDSNRWEYWGARVETAGIFIDDAGGTLNGGTDEYGQAKALQLTESSRIIAVRNTGKEQGLTLGKNGTITAILGGASGMYVNVNGFLFGGESSKTVKELLADMNAYAAIRYENTPAANALRASLAAAATADAINTYRVNQDGTSTYTTARDEIILDENAIVWGSIDLQAGNNFIDIHSNAQMFGDLQASLGTLNVQFNLRGDAQKGAIVSLTDKGVTENSIITFTADLLNVGRSLPVETSTGTTKGDAATKKKVVPTEYGIYSLIEGDLSIDWLNREISFFYRYYDEGTKTYVQETGHASINGDGVTFKDGARVYAVYVNQDGYVGGTNSTAKESIRLVVAPPPDTAAQPVITIKAEASGNYTHLFWNAVEGAVGYTVEYVMADGVVADPSKLDFSMALSFKCITEYWSGSAATNAYLALDRSTSQYYFRITAIKADGTRTEWDYSTAGYTVKSTGFVGSVSAVTNTAGDAQNNGWDAIRVSGGLVTDKGVYLDWSDAISASGIREYQVEYVMIGYIDDEGEYITVSGGIASTISVRDAYIGTLTEATEVYDVKTVISETILSGDLLTAGATYKWRVRAIGNDGTNADTDTGWSTENAQFTYNPTAAAGEVNPASPLAPTSLLFRMQGSVATFSWATPVDNKGDNANNIKRYIVEYSQYEDFSRDVIRKDLTATELVASGLVNFAQYFWRVKAIDASGNQSDWVKGDSFLVYAKDETGPDGIVKSSMTAEQTIGVAEATLSWAAVVDAQKDALTTKEDNYLSGVKGYVLEYSTDASFATSTFVTSSVDVIGAIPKTSYTLSGLVGDDSTTDYYWRVYAIDWAGNKSAVTNGPTFYVDTLAPDFNSIAVTVDGSTENGGAFVFNWDVTDNRPGSISYTVEIFTDASMSVESLLLTQALTDTSTFSTSVFATDDIDYNTYYWRVSATDGRQNTSFTTGAVTVDLVDDTPPPAVDGLVAPDQFGIFEFSWNGVVDNKSNPCTYTFVLSNDAAFGGNSITLSGLTVTTLNKNDITSAWGGVLPDNTQYYWKVISVDGAGNESIAVEGESFYFDTIAPTITSMNVTVTGSTETGADFTFNWVAADDRPGDVQYILEIFSDAAMTESFMCVGLLNDATYTFGKYTELEVDGKRFYWSITAIDGSQNSSTLTGSFDVDLLDDTAPSTIPYVIAPVQFGARNFAWGASEDNKSNPCTYTFVFSDSYGKTISISGLTTTSVTEQQILAAWGGDLADGKYTWSVFATDAAGNDGDGMGGNFTVYSTPMAYGLSADQDNVLELVHLSWNITLDDGAALDGSLSYYYEISTDRGFSHLVAEGTTQNTFVSVSGIDDFGSYYFRVTAIPQDNVRRGEASAPSSQFHTDYMDHETPSLPGDPRLTLTMSNNNITFAWDASTAGEGKNPLGYVLEIATDESFSSILETRTFEKGETSTQFEGKVFTDLTQYYWRVKAINRDGIEGEWITGTSFTTADITPPEKLTGLSSSIGFNTKTSLMDAVTLTWDEAYDVSGISSYYVEWSTSSTFASTPKSEKLDASATSFTITGLTEGTYYWRVWAVDASGNKNAMDKTAAASSAFTLTDVTGPLAMNGLVQVLDETTVKFSWKIGKNGTPNDIAYYIVEYALDKNFTIDAVRVETTELSLTVENLQEMKMYYWRVYAVDQTGNYGAKVKASSFMPIIDSGNTPATGRLLELGKTIIEDVGAVGDPIDYFLLEVTEKGLYSFTFEATEGSIEVLLYDNKMKKLSFKNGVSQELAIGTYCVSVTNKAKDSSSWYTLVADGKAYPGSTGNSTPATSTELTPTTPLQGWVGPGDPMDYYKFIITGAPGNFVFSLSDSGDGQLPYVGKNMTFELFTIDAKGKTKTVAKGKFNSKTGEFPLASQLAAGTYYIRISSSDKGKKKSSNYELSVSAQYYTLADNTNDTVAMALNKSALANSSKVTAWVGFSDSLDYYSFAVTGFAGNYTLSLSDPGTEFDFIAKNMKFTLGTVDAKGKFKAIEKGKIVNGEFLIQTDLAIGNYMILVESSDKGKKKNSSYLLDIAGIDYSKGNNADDTKAGATTLASKQSITDWVGFGDEVDYFQFAMGVGQQATLSLSGVEAKQNLKLTIYNAAGKSVGSLTSSAILKGSAWTKALATGTYYAAVTTTNEEKYMSDYTITLAIA